MKVKAISAGGYTLSVQERARAQRSTIGQTVCRLPHHFVGTPRQFPAVMQMSLFRAAGRRESSQFPVTRRGNDRFPRRNICVTAGN